MAAEVRGRVFGSKSPEVGIFADEFVDAAELAFPGGIFPGAADGRDVFEPGDFGGAALDFLAIAEFPGPAGAFEEEELMAGFRSFAMLLPVLVEGADIADERGDSGNGADQEMIFAAARGVESEAALRGFTDG